MRTQLFHNYENIPLQGGCCVAAFFSSGDPWIIP